ncbi:protoheme IX farnesyltransferase [bacterium]|nr:protoheme IX farnesyltransferase [bacterium]
MRAETAYSGFWSFQRIRDFVSLTKPRIMLLVILTVLGSMSVASGAERLAAAAVIWTLSGVALAVGAGGALNHFIERDADRKMARTADRPVASGRIRPPEALVFGTALWIASYFVLYFHANPPTAFLTMLAFGSYVGLYTPLKRRSSICTLIGAVPGALPALIGWTAVRGHVEMTGLVLFLLMFFWQIPHFLSLALLTRKDYAAAGMPMLPVEAGVPATLGQILLYTAALIPVSLLPYTLFGSGRVYLYTAVCAGAVFFYLAVLLDRKDAAPKWCGRFFAYSIVYITVLFGVLVFDS